MFLFCIEDMSSGLSGYRVLLIGTNSIRFTNDIRNFKVQLVDVHCCHGDATQFLEAF